MQSLYCIKGQNTTIFTNVKDVASRMKAVVSRYDLSEQMGLQTSEMFALSCVKTICLHHMVGQEPGSVVTKTLGWEKRCKNICNGFQ